MTLEATSWRGLSNLTARTSSLAVVRGKARAAMARGQKRIAEASLGPSLAKVAVVAKTAVMG